MIDLVKNLATVNRRTKGSVIRELLKITNKPDANRFLTKTYRKGWEL